MVIIQYILAVSGGRGERAWHYSPLKGGDRLSLVHRELLFGDCMAVRGQGRVGVGGMGWRWSFKRVGAMHTVCF